MSGQSRYFAASYHSNKQYIPASDGLDDDDEPETAGLLDVLILAIAVEQSRVYVYITLLE